MLAVQQHDLHRDGARDRARRQRQARDPARSTFARELDEGHNPCSRHRSGTGRQRRNVVGMHDPFGQAQHHGLDQEPASQHDRGRQPTVVAR